MDKQDTPVDAHPWSFEVSGSDGAVKYQWTDVTQKFLGECQSEFCLLT